jgi:hypothetical protein
MSARQVVGAASEILKLRVTLVGSKPDIWREVEVPSSMTLAALHDVLQVLMGWEDYHLWCFELDHRRFELPDPDGMSFDGTPPEDPRRVRVGGLLTKKGQVLDYYYDFGDDWCLEISVVASGKAVPKIRYPRCVAGERAGPPEDCGGVAGFAQLLAAHKNPKTEDDRELLEWVGEDWEPDAFDLMAVNKALSALRAPRRLH